MAGAKPAVAVADHRLFEFDALLMIDRAPNRRRRELAFAEVDHELRPDRDIENPSMNAPVRDRLRITTA